MRVVLYMASTANGFIAKKNHETPWSDGEWEAFSSFVDSAGNIIIGRRTYEIMLNGNEFEKLGNPFVVVVSKSLSIGGSGFVVADSPEQALKIIEKKGLPTAVVAGGSMLNSSFMKLGLVDEIIIDVEPFVFGSGIKMFPGADFESKLELIEFKRLPGSTIQLHYRVLK